MRQTRGLVGFLLIPFLAPACSATTLDPTELTRTISVQDRLSTAIVLQVCTAQDCSTHLGGDIVSRRGWDDVNVEDTSVNPFRVLAYPSRRALGCFRVGPRINQGQHYVLTPAKLGRC
jgi:hypothetical protein